MNGNICPKCVKPVMPYWRFLREADPYKISACGNCGAKLKRSPRVYLYLLFMLIVMAGASFPLFLALLEAHVLIWIIGSVTIIWLACWVLLMNFLSWRLIGWVVAENENK